MSVKSWVAGKLLSVYHKLEKKEDNFYGWIPQKPDQRDMKYAVSRPMAEEVVSLPPSVDLRAKLPAPWSQGQIGSCTAHGIAAALAFDEKVQAQAFIMPSRLFVYYNERMIEGTIPSDSGAQIRDGIKVVAKYGFPDEKVWPYVESKFTAKPSKVAYDTAIKHKALTYMSLDNTNLTELKKCLAAGFPFVFGFTVYDSFESEEVAKTGIMPMPKQGEQVQGGHCVICVGYDDASKTFLVRNSWGTDWGLSGHFKMPYSFMTNPNLASDFWTIRKIQ